MPDTPANLLSRFGQWSLFRGGFNYRGAPCTPAPAANTSSISRSAKYLPFEKATVDRRPTLGPCLDKPIFQKGR